MTEQYFGTSPISDMQYVRQDIKQDDRAGGSLDYPEGYLERMAAVMQGMGDEQRAVREAELAIYRETGHHTNLQELAIQAEMAADTSPLPASVKRNMAIARVQTKQEHHIPIHSGRTKYSEDLVEALDPPGTPNEITWSDDGLGKLRFSDSGNWIQLCGQASGDGRITIHKDDLGNLLKALQRMTQLLAKG